MASIFPRIVFNRHHTSTPNFGVKSDRKQLELGTDVYILPLVGKDTFIIGRHPDCDRCFLTNKYVSGKHCRLEVGRSSVFLYDTSSNGIYYSVNGLWKRLSKDRSAVLNDGDVVFLVKKDDPASDVAFTYEERAPSPEGGVAGPTLAYSPLGLDRGSATPPPDFEDEVNANAFGAGDTLPIENGGNGYEEEEETFPNPAYPTTANPPQPLPQPTRIRDQLAAKEKREAVPAELPPPKPDRSSSGSTAPLGSKSTSVTSTTEEPPSVVPKGGASGGAPDDDSMEETLNCSICCYVIHNCVSLWPCNHKFCNGCISEWMERSQQCPVCRKNFKKLSKDYQFNAIVDAFLKANPDSKRSDDELKELDQKSKVVNDVEKRKRKHPIKEDEGDDGSSDDEDSVTENDDSDDETGLPGPSVGGAAGGTRTRTGVSFSHQFLQRCRQCPVAKRAAKQASSPAKAAKGGDDGYECTTRQIHLLCSCCLELFPHRPGERSLPKVRCQMCSNHYCHLYWGCNKLGCSGCIGKVTDHKFGDVDLNDVINGNAYESQILKDYLSSQDITAEIFFTGILAEMNGKREFSGLDAICHTCLRKPVQQQAYIYRANIAAADLPEAVTSRPDCWWGKNCRTQRSKPDHARKLNHVCEQSRT